MKQPKAPELENVRGNAWTFSDVRPPAGAELIAVDKRENDTYYYYTNPDPEDAKERPYLFETESGYKFKAEMEAATKRIRKKERKKRCDA